MPATQLRLLPSPQPLVERLGAGFFRDLPHAPGIYRFFDAEGRLLYVGKARDLHARLASYRRTHGQSRKTIRLIHAAYHIEWELQPSDVAARLRENDLIRTLRPRFNRVGTWPRSARFLSLSTMPGGFLIDLTLEPGSESYGAFRNGPAVALLGLARLLWFAWHGTALTKDLPRALLAADELRHFAGEHPAAPAWLDDLRAWLSGVDDRLIGRLLDVLPESCSPFDAHFVAHQFEVLSDFFRLGPYRNRRLQTFLPSGRSLLAPEERDDLLVLLGAKPPACPDVMPEDVLQPP